MNSKDEWKKKSVHNFTHFRRLCEAACNVIIIKAIRNFNSNTLMRLMIFLTKIRKFESVTCTRRVYSLGRFHASSCARFVSEKRVPWHVAYAICTYTAGSGHTWAYYMHFFPCLHTLFLLLQSQNVPSALTTSAFLNRSYHDIQMV